MTVLIDTADLDDVERFVSANYCKVRLTPASVTASRTRVAREQVGDLILDDFAYGVDFEFESYPCGAVVLCLVRAGAVIHRSGHDDAHMCRPGEVMAVGAQDGASFSGEAHGLHCDTIALDAHLLATVAESVDTDGVRLTSTTPVSPMAGAVLINAIRHVKHSVMSDPYAAQSPLVIGDLRRYLAAGL